MSMRTGSEKGLEPDLTLREHACTPGDRQGDEDVPPTVDLKRLESLFDGRGPDTALPLSIAWQNKLQVKDFYDRINQTLDQTIYSTDAIFLNLGYLADGSPRSAQIALPSHWPNRNQIELILELIGACELRDRDLLDIGCGRGGTIVTIDHFFSPGEIWGLDLSPSAVAFCRNRNRKRGIHFINGDSERLPFLDNFFEIVTDVESSCLYQDIYAFYREVYRVLAHGGYFLYADLMPAAHLDTYRSYLRSLGFTLERDQDISRNVLLSIEREARKHLEIHKRQDDRGLLEFFLAAPGSKPYRDLREGRLSYRIWHLIKGFPDALS